MIRTFYRLSLWHWILPIPDRTGTRICLKVSRRIGLKRATEGWQFTRILTPGIMYSMCEDRTTTANGMMRVSWFRCRLLRRIGQHGGLGLPSFFYWRDREFHYTVTDYELKSGG